ncbi:acyltransferase [Microbacterium radiodurans]|uniref:Acyltransferase n=1 Tax=Microbacterium radiodurans TaxID=661398 RepID=A0A5J5IMU5_9MICO|nr:acyltransferase [Microbacterium radiodurans]KAA9084084.1 acyltransferase [Microbacterium radiodurans]
MSDKVRDVVRLVLWLLPAGAAKNALLRRAGHRVHPTARARPSIVWRVGSFELAPHSSFGFANVVKNMREIRLGRDAMIGRWNLISSHESFVRHLPTGGALVLGDHAKITSRHQLDCSGSVSLGPFASVAGHQSRVMSHSVDLARNAQTALPVVIGERSFVSTRVLVLGGAVLPARSVLGAGSVLIRARGVPEPGLWAGVPAKLRGPVSGAWFEREETSTHDLWIPATDTIVHTR